MSVEGEKDRCGEDQPVGRDLAGHARGPIGHGGGHGQEALAAFPLTQQAWGREVGEGGEDQWILQGAQTLLTLVPALDHQVLAQLEAVRLFLAHHVAVKLLWVRGEQRELEA